LPVRLEGGQRALCAPRPSNAACCGAGVRIGRELPIAVPTHACGTSRGWAAAPTFAQRSLRNRRARSVDLQAQRPDDRGPARELVFHVAAVCLRIELTVRLERPGDQQLPVVAVGQQISSLFVSGSSAPSGLMQDRKSFTIGLARRSWDTRSPLSRGSAVVLAGQRPRARDAEARRASDFRNQPTTSAACWLWPSLMPRAFIQS